MESVGVHRSIADVWRSVAAAAGRPLPSMSAADIRRELGRGVLSEAAPAESALFGGEVVLGLEGERAGMGPTAQVGGIDWGSLDCSCHDGSIKVGDPCGQGGRVSAVTKSGYASAAEPFPCVTSYTCRDGNQCECAEAVPPGAGNWTCHDHGEFRYPIETQCDYVDGSCRCSVLCDDGTWQQDLKAPNGRPPCPPDGSVSERLVLAPVCRGLPGGVASPIGSSPLVSAPPGESKYDVPDGRHVSDCLTVSLRIAEWLRLWNFSDIEWSTPIWEGGTGRWTMYVSGKIGGLKIGCMAGFSWNADCSDLQTDWTTDGCPPRARGDK